MTVFSHIVEFSFDEGKCCRTADRVCLFHDRENAFDGIDCKAETLLCIGAERTGELSVFDAFLQCVKLIFQCCFCIGIRMRRSFFVVTSLMAKGWMIGTSAM